MDQLSIKKQNNNQIDQAPIYNVILGDPENNCMGAGICHIDEKQEAHDFVPKRYNQVLAHTRNSNGYLELGFLKKTIPKKYQEQLFQEHFVVCSAFNKHTIQLGSIHVNPAKYPIIKSDEIYYVRFSI